MANDMATTTGEGRDAAPQSSHEHPPWCRGGEQDFHEHYLPPIKVPGAFPLLVELAMDPDTDESPRVAVLPAGAGRELFEIELFQALELSHALTRIVAAALTPARPVPDSRVRTVRRRGSS